MVDIPQIYLLSLDSYLGAFLTDETQDQEIIILQYMLFDNYPNILVHSVFSIKRTACNTKRILVYAVSIFK